MFLRGHKIQIDKRERFSSGGLCHCSAGCQRGSKSASGAISPVWTSSLGGAPKDDKPTMAVIFRKSESVWLLQRQGFTVAGSLQQHEAAGAQGPWESNGKFANPGTRVTRKQATRAKNLFTTHKK